MAHYAALSACTRTGARTPLQVNPLYLAQLQRVLTFPQSVGIVGGRPGASLYLLGYQVRPPSGWGWGWGGGATGGRGWCRIVPRLVGLLRARSAPCAVDRPLTLAAARVVPTWRPPSTHEMPVCVRAPPPLPPAQRPVPGCPGGCPGPSLSEPWRPSRGARRWRRWRGRRRGGWWRLRAALHLPGPPRGAAIGAGAATAAAAAAALGDLLLRRGAAHAGGVARSLGSYWLPLPRHT